MSTTSLTERYVHEVIRRIPADQREEVAKELRATIADTVEARDAAEPDSAERTVLTEMGDPIRLAARYADRPLVLIGADLFPAYQRLLVILLFTVLPVITAVSVVTDLLDNNDLGSAIGAGVGTVLAVGAQMIAWLTVVFALVERLRPRDGLPTWTPDQLREVRQSDKPGAGAYAAAVWNTLLIALIVWQYAAKPYRTDGGTRLQVLDPDLWSGWIWPILAGLAGMVVLNLVRVAARRWTMPLAIWYAVAEVAFAVPLAWILYQHMLFNPDFLTAVSDNLTVSDAFYTVTALGVLVVSASEVVKRLRDARG